MRKGEFTLIVHKRWSEQEDEGDTKWMREGYFLFGIIPLFISDVTARIRFCDSRLDTVYAS